MGTAFHNDSGDIIAQKKIISIGAVENCARFVSSYKTHRTAMYKTWAVSLNLLYAVILLFSDSANKFHLQKLLVGKFPQKNTTECFDPSRIA